MSHKRDTRVDIRIPTHDRNKRYWVLQALGPVEDLFRSTGYFMSDVEAVADFKRTCDILGWQTFVNDTPGDDPDA